MGLPIDITRVIRMERFRHLIGKMCNVEFDRPIEFKGAPFVEGSCNPTFRVLYVLLERISLERAGVTMRASLGETTITFEIPEHNIKSIRKMPYSADQYKDVLEKEEAVDVNGFTAFEKWE